MISSRFYPVTKTFSKTYLQVPLPLQMQAAPPLHPSVGLQDDPLHGLPFGGSVVLTEFVPSLNDFSQVTTLTFPAPINRRLLLHLTAESGLFFTVPIAWARHHSSIFDLEFRHSFKNSMIFARIC